jgi:arsenical pump membrane protein
LAFAVSGLSFLRFSALMTSPWLAAVAVEYAVFRVFFARELKAACSGVLRSSVHGEQAT